MEAKRKADEEAAVAELASKRVKATTDFRSRLRLENQRKTISRDVVSSQRVVEELDTRAVWVAIFRTFSFPISPLKMLRGCSLVLGWRVRRECLLCAAPALLGVLLDGGVHADSHSLGGAP